MRDRIAIGASYYLEPNRGEAFTGGVIFHEVRNALGGSTATPIGHVFVTTPEIGAEGYHPHLRLDCIIKKHKLAPEPAGIARALVVELKSRGLVAEPIWVGWWQGRELGGEAQGEVFDFD